MEISRASKLLYADNNVGGIDTAPESLPIYQTTAFSSRSLDEVVKRYAGVETGDMYSYYRCSNPNRSALAEMMSVFENGEASFSCSSGMGAIAAVLFTFLKSGDHVIYSNCCYGESLDLMKGKLRDFGVETTPVNIEDLEEVRAAARSNTRIVYTEVVANPLMKVADIDALAEFAHSLGAILVVDNTFSSPISIRPLEHGADIVINSMTKFLGGHSDACGGVITASAGIIKTLDPMIQHYGTPLDPFTAWLLCRSLKTADLRIKKQMSNAAKLAKALMADPHIAAVYHPSVPGFSGHETALKLWGDKPEEMCGMLGVMLNTEDFDKRNAFSKALTMINYAPTLGGLKTTYQQPVISSHSHMPDEERRKIGITPALVRVSVGIEEPEDIINDFINALRAMD